MTAIERVSGLLTILLTGIEDRAAIVLRVRDPIVIVVALAGVSDAIPVAVLLISATEARWAARGVGRAHVSDSALGASSVYPRIADIDTVVANISRPVRIDIGLIGVGDVHTVVASIT